MKLGIFFVSCDKLGADPFRLHIEAAIAEEGARKIRKRTKPVLRAV